MHFNQECEARDFPTTPMWPTCASRLDFVRDAAVNFSPDELKASLMDHTKKTMLGWARFWEEFRWEELEALLMARWTLVLTSIREVNWEGVAEDVKRRAWALWMEVQAILNNRNEIDEMITRWKTFWALKVTLP